MTVLNLALLQDFVAESNRIEGIHREPLAQEVQATSEFITAPQLTVVRVKALVAVYQPNARLRNKVGLDVRVGNHVPLPGGPVIEEELGMLLTWANSGAPDPYEVHCRYETLHPFTDGNGRSGRAIWLWQMVKIYNRLPPLGFLHTWYYQSLQHCDARKA